MTVHVVLKQALSMNKLHKLKNEIREKLQFKGELKKSGLYWLPSDFVFKVGL